MTPVHDEHAQPRERIDLPAPTTSPMVVAVGITLAFAGLITHAAVSVVGIVQALAPSARAARRVLLASLLYLPLLLGLLAFDRR